MSPVSALKLSVCIVVSQRFGSSTFSRSFIFKANQYKVEWQLTAHSTVQRCTTYLEVLDVAAEELLVGDIGPTEGHLRGGRIALVLLVERLEGGGQAVDDVDAAEEVVEEEGVLAVLVAHRVAGGRQQLAHRLRLQLRVGLRRLRRGGGLLRLEVGAVHQQHLVGALVLLQVEVVGGGALLGGRLQPLNVQGDGEEVVAEAEGALHHQVVEDEVARIAVDVCERQC